MKGLSTLTSQKKKPPEHRASGRLPKRVLPQQRSKNTPRLKVALVPLEKA